MPLAAANAHEPFPSTNHSPKPKRSKSHKFSESGSATEVKNILAQVAPLPGTNTEPLSEQLQHSQPPRIWPKRPPLWLQFFLQSLPPTSRALPNLQGRKIPSILSVQIFKKHSERTSKLLFFLTLGMRRQKIFPLQKQRNRNIGQKFRCRASNHPGQRNQTI